MRRTFPRAFSLVELLVVVAVVCVLLAVLFPAVQSARAAARRASCINNLKQIALAFQNYATVWNSLPLSMSIGTGHGNGGSAFAGVLPFAELAPLYNMYNFSLENWNISNDTAVRTQVKIFLCPDNPDVGTVPAEEVRFPDSKAVFAKGHFGRTGEVAESAGIKVAPRTGERRRKAAARAVGRGFCERSRNISRCDDDRHHSGWRGEGQGRQAARPERSDGRHYRRRIVHVGVRREAR